MKKMYTDYSRQGKHKKRVLNSRACKMCGGAIKVHLKRRKHRDCGRQFGT